MTKNQNPETLPDFFVWLVLIVLFFAAVLSLIVSHSPIQGIHIR